MILKIYRQFNIKQLRGSAFIDKIPLPEYVCPCSKCLVLVTSVIPFKIVQIVKIFIEDANTKAIFNLDKPKPHFIFFTLKCVGFISSKLVFKPFHQTFI